MTMGIFELQVERAGLAAKLQVIDHELARMRREAIDAPVQAASESGQCLSVAQAAKYLNVSMDWMYRQHEIPYVKRGRRKVFELRALDSWKAKHTIDPSGKGQIS